MAEAITLEQLQAALKPVTDQLAQIKPLQDQVTALTSNFKSLGDNQKVIADTLAALPPAGKKEEPKQEALTLQGVTDKVLGEVKNLLSAQQQTASQQQARAAYIAAKMAKVPEAYQSRLGNDPAKWPAEEQAIREQLKTDLAALGVKADTIAGDAPAGAVKPGAVVDTSKMKGVELIELAVTQSTPQQRTATAAVATATDAGGAAKK